MVIATKYTGCDRLGNGAHETIKIKFSGNHAKSMTLSLEASLRKLNTDYIDLFYVHWWDFTTSVPELMRNLHRLVMQGKILYLGISDTPAWVVSKANEYARAHGLTPFSVYQGLWKAAERDVERDILPMIHEEGMALAPWGVLGSGNLRTKEQRETLGAESGARQMFPATEKDVKVSEVLDAMAKRKGTQLTSIALAYVMHKAPYVVPVVGGRKLEYLKSNVEALRLDLSDKEIDEIESAVPFDVGFPMKMLFQFPSGTGRYSTRMTARDIKLTSMGGDFDVVERPRPIRPHAEEISGPALGLDLVDFRKDK